jgi:hypothetical protein
LPKRDGRTRDRFSRRQGVDLLIWHLRQVLEPELPPSFH